MATNTTTDIAPAVVPYYDRILLMRLLPYLVHDLFADRRPLPKGESDQAKFRKYTTLATATTPISEGVVPSGSLATYTEVTFILDQYGDYLKYTDKVSLINQDPVITEFTELSGEQAGETIDELRRNSFNAGTNVRRATAAASRNAITAKISANDLKFVERAMLDNKCRYMSKMVDPQNGYATTPTRAAFFVIAHSDAKSDIEDLTNFQSVEKYAPNTKVHESEIGQVGNFRFIITNKAKNWPDTGGTAVTNTLVYTTADSSCDVYSFLVFSEHAVAITDLEGEGLQMITKARTSGGPENPLNQFGTTGWVAWTTQGILDDTRLYRIEAGVSRLT
jgi:N4-gp56 family major capsid protein